MFADSTPSFCYSTGIYKSFGIPEIFISSLPKNLSQGLIENYVNKFKNSDSIPIDKRIDDLTDRFSIYLNEVPTGYYNEENGFVKLDYINIDKSKLTIEIKEITLSKQRTANKVFLPWCVTC